jgi:hypothetical protein
MAHFMRGNDVDKNVDSQVWGHDLPSQVSDSRLIATLQITTSNDFKGTIPNWGMPAPK